MRKLLTLALLGAALFTVSCINVHNNKGASANLPAAYVKPVCYRAVTEIGKERVEATVSGNRLFKVIKWGLPGKFADNGDFGSSSESAVALPLLSMFAADAYGDFKQAATYAACEKYGCDSLMDARYVITSKNYFVFEQITCKVTGVPVKITGYDLIECKK